MAFTQGDRTEKPTGRRLKDARKKGQVPRSADLGQAAALGAVLIVLVWAGAGMVQQVGRLLGEGLARAGDWSMRDLQAGDLTGLAVGGARDLVLLTAPVAVAGAVASILVASLQGGWVFASEAIRFDWTRLSPSNGIKRLGLTTGGAETLKSLIAVTVLGVLSERVLMTLIHESDRMTRMAVVPTAIFGWSQAVLLLEQSVIALGLLAAADYGLQRYRFSQSMKMTKAEVKEDTKLAEGSPETKSRVRRVQREMARRRMLQATKTATLVITNPTHYAIALEYRRDVMPAPRVVAKGQDLLAARIKEIAREHGVPVVENKPLAQALYRTAEIGDLIPGDLFEAVAEVLAYLIRLKQLVL
jgi:flagellar biosynthetic protein FlhB